MSYEGHVEMVCAEGHYWTKNANVFSYSTKQRVKEAVTCPTCRRTSLWSCNVDETNGFDIEDRHSFGGVKIQLNPHVELCRDVFGNLYINLIPRFRVDNTYNRWVIDPEVTQLYTRPHRAAFEIEVNQQFRTYIAPFSDKFTAEGKVELLYAWDTKRVRYSSDLIHDLFTRYLQEKDIDNIFPAV